MHIPGFCFMGEDFTSLWHEAFLLTLLFSIQKLTLNTDSLDTVILDNVCFLDEMGHIWQARAWDAVKYGCLPTYACQRINEHLILFQ